jgi:hypothetical protein
MHYDLAKTAFFFFLCKNLVRQCSRAAVQCTHAQAAGVPVSWVNTTVVPSSNISAPAPAPSSSGGRRRLQQQSSATPSSDGGIDVTTSIATPNPQQVQQRIQAAQSNGQLGQQLSGVGLTLVPQQAATVRPLLPAVLPAISLHSA